MATMKVYFAQISDWDTYRPLSNLCSYPCFGPRYVIRASIRGFETIGIWLDVILTHYEAILMGLGAMFSGHRYGIGGHSNILSDNMDWAGGHINIL